MGWLRPEREAIAEAVAAAKIGLFEVWAKIAVLVVMLRLLEWGGVLSASIALFLLGPPYAIYVFGIRHAVAVAVMGVLLVGLLATLVSIYRSSVQDGGGAYSGVLLVGFTFLSVAILISVVVLSVVIRFWRGTGEI